MPQSPSNRQNSEYQKFLLKQELYRLYGSDYSEMKWVRETLKRMETRRWDVGYSDQDHANQNKARNILDRAKAIATFYDPNQARNARGRWTGDGKLNVQDSVAHLNNAVPQTPQGKCAEYVRKAIEAGGIVFKKEDRPKSGSAKDYGDTLQKYGFDVEEKASAGQGFPPNKNYRPQAGDVAVIQSTSTSRDGHMAMFNGKQWISDFAQKDFWPGKAYTEQKPSYVIYRHPRVQ